MFVKTDTSGNCLPQLLIERGGRGRETAQHSFITPIYDRGRAEREREGRGRVRMRGCQNPLRQISAIHLHVKRGGQSVERERERGERGKQSIGSRIPVEEFRADFQVFQRRCCMKYTGNRVEKLNCK